MNVFEKLNEARLRFQNANVKKSGQNKFAGYTYYELADILPAINKIAQELKFTCIVNFTKDLATLSFVDCEKNEKIEFTSPMAEANLKGCQQVQNLGGAETYIKRYLYQNCFEIVESDMLDGTMNPNAKPDKAEELIALIKPYMATMSDEQLDCTNKAISERNVSKLFTILNKCEKPNN